MQKLAALSWFVCGIDQATGAIPLHLYPQILTLILRGCASIDRLITIASLLGRYAVSNRRLQWGGHRHQWGKCPHFFLTMPGDWPPPQILLS